MFRGKGANVEGVEAAFLPLELWELGNPTIAWDQTLEQRYAMDLRQYQTRMSRYYPRA